MLGQVTWLKMNYLRNLFAFVTEDELTHAPPVPQYILGGPLFVSNLGAYIARHALKGK